MCTVTWIVESHGYQLFFNRDELRTRKPAEKPTIRTNAILPFIAPADGDHGGSWIAVNEAGLCVCLLNGDGGREAQPPTGTTFVSRGLLPLTLADCTTTTEIGRRISQSEKSSRKVA